MDASLPGGVQPTHVRPAALLPLVCCLLGALLGGCGESDAPVADPVPSSADAALTKAATPKAGEERRTIDPATVGAVHGVVTASGVLPEPKLLPMTSEPYCVAAHEAAGGVLDERIQVTDGRLRNAFVWVKSGLEGYEFEAPSTTVELDQVGCLYHPRVVGAQLGQGILVANSDDVMHNVHTHPDRNRPQNIAQIAGSAPRELQFKKPEVMIKVACDVHAWMAAWIGVVDHPFFAVTGPDGSYRLEGLPPGEYTLGVWHEKLGEQEVTVVLDEGADVAAGEVVFQL